MIYISAENRKWHTIPAVGHVFGERILCEQPGQSAVLASIQGHSGGEKLDAKLQSTIKSNFHMDGQNFFITLDLLVMTGLSWKEVSP